MLVEEPRPLPHQPEACHLDVGGEFAGLDAPSANLLEQMLESLNRAGKTIILANHDIRRSLELAQRAIVLRRGHLAIDEPTADLDWKHVLEVVSA